MRGTVNVDTPIRRHADTPHRAVFLDRDGVINRPLIRAEKPYPPSSLDEFEILPGVPGACELLKKLGFLLVVATNQPDVGRGTLSRASVETIYLWLSKQLPIDAIFTCFHADGADKVGMLNLYRNPLIKGLTINPTLMRKGGIHDYENFAQDILKQIKDKPISFEVFSDGSVRTRAASAF